MEQVQKLIDPTRGQASFCPYCSILLEAADGDDILCNCCGNKCTYADLPLESFSIITASTERSEPQWIVRRRAEEKNEELRNKNKGRSQEEVVKDGEDEALRPTVDEVCPKCSHGKASFYTIQMRSVDEGQTVFYTCVKCEYKWKLNN